MFLINWHIVLAEILGDLPLEKCIAHCFIMGAGAVVFFGLDVRHSVKTNQDTPRKFNVKFAIKDNVLRILAVVFAILAVVVFHEDLFGVPLNAKMSFMNGLSIDAIIGSLGKMAKETGAGKRKRTQLAAKYNN